MRSLFLGFLKSWTRFTSFIGKEVTEVVRRPGVLVSMVLGPFIIMAIFGFGYDGQRRPLSTILVLPDTVQDLPRDRAFYQDLVGQGVNLLEVTSDLEGARARLNSQQVDMVVVAPPDVSERFANGQQSDISVEYNQIDPVRDNYARFIAYRQVQELNRVIIEQMVGAGYELADQRLGENPINIPPEVVASPTRAEAVNWAPLQPTVVAFFAPAVLALVLQHMAVTLTALSLVRERMSGAMDIFRVAPVRTWEILLGKYLAYGFFNLAIATLISFLMVLVLGIPLLGDVRTFATVILLMTFASLGMGLFISTVVDSERQAVQLSMLVLLASVFFSGFVMPLDEFQPLVQWLAYALPVTHGIRLLQDIMLRGATAYLWQFWALAGIGAFLFILTTLTLRRTLRLT